MNLFNVILMNSILVVFPFCCYFLYLIYTKTLERKKSDLFLDIAIISSFYAILKFENLNYLFITYIFLNIPLLIAYFYEKKISIFFLSVLSIFYYINIFSCGFLFFTIEYIVYVLLYFLLQKENIHHFFNIFLVVKGILLCENIVYFHHISFPTIFILLCVLIILVKFLLSLFQKMNEVLMLHCSIKQVQNDQKLYESLFKITHEIKNPIAVIKGYLDMFDIHNPNHTIQYIPILKGEVNRVLVLLEDFLSINRIHINKEIIDIVYLIEEVIESFEPLLKKKKIDFVFNAPEIYIEADYNRLKQVFINVIKNSVEAISSNGKIIVNIRIQNKYLLIEIIDNGVGMNSEDIEKLNYPFFTTKQNGTGLGVYLSKEIIEKHSGTMKYQSNQGMKVTIKLPYDASLN